MKALARFLSGNLNGQLAKPSEKVDTSSRPSSGDAEDNVLRDKFDKETISSLDHNKHGKHISGGKVRERCPSKVLL